MSELDPGYKILNEVRLPTDPKARLYETKFGFLDGIPLRLSSYSVSPNFMGDIDGEYGLIKCLVYSKFKAILESSCAGISTFTRNSRLSVCAIRWGNLVTIFKFIKITNAKRLQYGFYAGFNLRY